MGSQVLLLSYKLDCIVGKQQPARFKMPIIVFVDFGEDAPRDDKPKSVAWLCEDSWELPFQLDKFQLWLENEGNELPAGRYIADIGFSQRPDACGGGGTLSVSTMRKLVELGIEIWFSEYRR